MWKFQDFTDTQILCEIKFGDYKVWKSAILTNSEAVIFEFHEFLHFLKAEFYQMNKIQSFKNGSFRTSNFSKINIT